MRSTAAPSSTDADADGPAPQLRRKFTLFSSADGEDGMTSDHTRQRTVLLRIAAFFLRSMYMREFLFLVLLGVLSALLALGISAMLDKAIALRSLCIATPRLKPAD